MYATSKDPPAMPKAVISTPHASSAIGTYSQAVRCGDTIYVSGQIGLDPVTMQLAEGIDAQVKRVFNNLKAVAEAAGGSLDDARQTDDLSHRSCPFRQGQRNHGRIFQTALSGARRNRRRLPAACRLDRGRCDIGDQ